MKSVPDLDFGYFIAFFLPGALALYALGDVAPPVNRVFGGLFVKDQAVGASLFILVAGLMAGIVISSFRALVLEWFYKKAGIEMRPLNFAALAQKETYSAYKSAINATYRFYQFNANMGLSLGFFILARYFLAGESIRVHRSEFTIYIIAFIVLMLQAPRSLKSTYATLGQILGDKAGKSTCEPISTVPE